MLLGGGRFRVMPQRRSVTAPDNQVDATLQVGGIRGSPREGQNMAGGCGWPGRCLAQAGVREKGAPCAAIVTLAGRPCSPGARSVGHPFAPSHACTPGALLRRFPLLQPRPAAAARARPSFAAVGRRARTRRWRTAAPSRAQATHALPLRAPEGRCRVGAQQGAARELVQAPSSSSRRGPAHWWAANGACVLPPASILGGGGTVVL